MLSSTTRNLPSGLAATCQKSPSFTIRALPALSTIITPCLSLIIVISPVPAIHASCVIHSLSGVIHVFESVRA